MKEKTFLIAFFAIVIIIFLGFKYCPFLKSKEKFVQFRDPIFLSGRRIDYLEEEATGKLGYGFFSGYSPMDSVL
jgi:hypothetical protein